jgi:hypothetical protein
VAIPEDIPSQYEAAQAPAKPLQNNMKTHIIVIGLFYSLPAWAESLIYSDDFSVQRPEWALSVDGGYIGQPTPQGNLTQQMIDGAIGGSFANIAGGSLNLKSNSTISNAWGAASATLNIELPEDFRITFTSVKSQWAGHQRLKFIEADPTAPLLYNPLAANHGRAIQFGVAGYVTGNVYFEPTENTEPVLLDVARDGSHVVGHVYDYEITKIGNHFEIDRDGALQYDYSGSLSLDFMNYLSFVNYQAGATSSVDNLRVYSIPEPSSVLLLLGSGWLWLLKARGRPVL